MGLIGLDPCSNPQSTVGAMKNFCFPEDNGLLLPWGGYGGQTYVNPPYGRKLMAWSDKIVHEAKLLVPIVALTPARTDTKWCQQLLNACTEALFWKGRLKFIDPENPGKQQSAPFPSLVTYFGEDPKNFQSAFSSNGIFMSR